MAYKLYTDKQENFECKIYLEGASLQEAKSRLVVEGNNFNLLFELNFFHHYYRDFNTSWKNFISEENLQKGDVFEIKQISLNLDPYPPTLPYGRFFAQSCQRHQ